MIDEKTDRTRGSPDSELNALGGYNNEGEEEEEHNTFPINGDDTFGITPLTKNAVTELARLSGHGEKQFFELIVQVVHLK